MEEGEMGRKGEGEMEESKTCYAVVEMMGHRKVVGIITESGFGPGSLIRVDVLGKDGEVERTEHVGIGSIYCLTEVTEDVAKATAAAHSPKPSWAYGIGSDRQLGAGIVMQTEYNDDGFDDDDDDQERGYRRSLLGLPND